MKMRTTMAGVSTAALVLSVWMMATVRRQDEAEDQRDLGENGRSISLMASSQGGRWRHLRMSTGQVGSMPPSACDMESMRQCQEEMQVKVNSLHDPRSPSRFCHDLVAPFQCACRTCDPQQLWTWNEKCAICILICEVTVSQLLEMNQDIQPGGSCFSSYHLLCHAPLDAAWCPAVLSHLGESRYGVALTLLNDETEWINPAQTCKSSRAFERERECRDSVRKRSFPMWKHCSQMHEFVKCMCNACEEDVEERVRHLGSFSRCPRLQQVSHHLPHCDAWYEDECIAEHGASFCEHVHGSDAWKATQEPASVQPGGSEGMSWNNFCSGVVSSLSASEEVLEENLGAGWREWCKKYLNSSSKAEERGEEGEEGEEGGDEAEE